MLTVIAHELGHAFGFTDDVPGFGANVVFADEDGGIFLTDVGEAHLTGDLDHLDSNYHPGSLMNPTLPVGLRKLPSALDAQVLREAWRDSEWESGVPSFSVNYLHTIDHLDPHGGFILFADAIAEDLAAGPPTGIRDGGFDQQGTPDWNQIGGVDTSGSQAVLTEDTNFVFSDVSQVFRVPVGAQKIRFSVSGLSLQTNGMGIHPPDAFEVALLDAISMNPLAGVVNGLSMTDSLLNLQPGGVSYAADSVTVIGDISSGAFDVEIDLAGIAADTAAVLFFDLVRFGDVGSTVTIDGVTILEDPDPTNSDPSVAPGAPETITEGDTFTKNGSFTDADGADIFTATIDFGDGSGVQPLALNGGAFSFSHTFVQDGFYQVVVTVTDSLSGSGTATWDVTVENALPVVDPIAPISQDIAQPVNVTATFTDVGLADTHTATIDWGDGTVEAALVNELTGQVATPDHSYANTGIYNAVLTVFDDDGSTAVPFSIEITKELTLATVSGGSEIAEGSVYVLDLDVTGPEAANVTEWTIDWGDGTVQTLTGNPSFAFHIYGDGPFDARITATATNGVENFGASALDVSVVNSDPQISLFEVESLVNEGDTVTLSGVFQDRGTGEEHSVTVDWGDGTVETFTLPAEARSFSFTHRYGNNQPNDAPFQIAAFLRDAPAGPAVSRFALVQVVNTPPTGNVQGPGNGRVNDPLQYFGAASDSGPGDALEVSWDFGDGTVLPFQPVGNIGALSPTHQYRTAGDYPVMLMVRDSDGALGFSTVLVTVDPLPIVNAPTPKSGDLGAEAPAGGLVGRIDTGLAGFLAEVASQKTLVSFLTIEEWRNERLTGQLAAVGNLQLTGSFVLVPSMWLPWQSLYEQASRLALVMEYWVAETLQVVHSSIVFEESGEDTKIVVTLGFNRDVADEISADDLVISLPEAILAFKTTLAYDAETRTATFTVTLPKDGIVRGAVKIQFSIADTAIADEQGNRMDGDGDGVPGGSLLLTVPVPESR